MLLFLLRPFQLCIVVRHLSKVGGTVNQQNLLPLFFIVIQILFHALIRLITILLLFLFKIFLKPVINDLRSYILVNTSYQMSMKSDLRVCEDRELVDVLLQRQFFLLAFEKVDESVAHCTVDNSEEEGDPDYPF